MALNPNLIGAHASVLLMKAKSLLSFSIMASPFAYFAGKIHDWCDVNESYTLWVLGAIAVDHLIGTGYHLFYKKDFSFKKNVVGLIVKLLLVVSVGYIFEGVQSLSGGENILTEYTTITLRLMVFLYPASSALENAAAITGGKFPPTGIMKKIASLTKTGSAENEEPKKEI